MANRKSLVSAYLEAEAIQKLEEMSREQHKSKSALIAEGVDILIQIWEDDKIVKGKKYE